MNVLPNLYHLTVDPTGMKRDFPDDMDDESDGRNVYAVAPSLAQHKINEPGNADYTALWDLTQKLCKEWTRDDGAIGCRNIVAAMYFAAKFMTPGLRDPVEVMRAFPRNEAWFEYENRFLGFYIKEIVEGKKLRLSSLGKQALKSVGEVKFSVLLDSQTPKDWAKMINKDCSDATMEMIPEIANEELLADEQLECYLMAAEYVKVIWSKLFLLDKTEKDADFIGYINGKKEVEGKCQMMKNNVKRYALFTGEHCWGVFLPTLKANIQVLAVLPKKREVQAEEGEETPIKKSSDEIAERGQDVLVAAKTQHDVIVEIPRMELKMKPTSIIDICAKVFPAPMFEDTMGLTESYNEVTGGWRSRHPLKIGSIDHATYIMMDEMGAKAAAATGIAMFRTRSSAAPDPVFPLKLRFDRPYILYIVDTNRGDAPATLFKATVMNSGALKGAPAPEPAAYAAAAAAQQARE